MSTQEAATTATAKTKPAKKKAQVTKAKGRVKAAKSIASAAKIPKAAKPKATRDGSKSAAVLELMRRKEGATLAEIAKATDWQSHSIRGFVSGYVARKMGLKVESTKNDAGVLTGL
jgi:hypothetical protein